MLSNSHSNIKITLRTQNQVTQNQIMLKLKWIPVFYSCACWHHRGACVSGSCKNVSKYTENPIKTDIENDKEKEDSNFQ